MTNQTLQEKNLQKVSARQKGVKIAVQVLLYAFLGIMALIIVFPFYWMIISSLKSTVEYRLPVPTLFPKEIMWGNYVEAFSAANLGRLFLNTVFVGIFGDDMQAVGGASLNTMVGYIYDALGNREGRASAAALILFAIIFVVTMINLYVSKKKTHY